MIADNKLELVIQVDVSQGNAEIKQFNAGLDAMQRQAVDSTRKAASSFEGMIGQLKSVRSELKSLFVGGIIVAYADRFGQALARMVVSLLNWQDTLQQVKKTLHDVFNPLDAARQGLVDEARQQRLEKVGKAILESQARVADLQRQAALVGLSEEARLAREANFAIDELRKRQLEQGLPIGQVTAEYKAIVELFTRQVAEVRRKAAEERAKESRAAIEKAREVSFREAQEAIRAMETEREHRQALLADRLRDEAKALDTLVELEREAALARLDPYQKTIQEMAFKDEDRVRNLRRLLDEQLITEAEFNKGVADLAKISAANTEKVLADQAREIQGQYRSTFESLKFQAGQVFDALLTKSQSVFGAIGNALKTAILTAIRDIVSSHVAATLMQLFYGVRVSFAGAAGGLGRGPVGGLLGIGAPIFLGGGGLGIPGAGPGGTPPFLPGPVGGGGGLGGALGLAGLLPGLKSFLGIGGSIQLGPGVATTFEAATLLQKLSAMGRSPAALFGGGLLAVEGLRRGGLSGMGMTTAGGALIGFKFGGPLGAAIGGVAGAVAGLFGLFRKSAEEKAREKIKATYGVDIKDKGVLRQIVEIARQGFGGNLDMAIRTAQVRELIELYALSTGQSTARLPAGMKPVSLVQSGGSLFQFGSLPSLARDRISPGAPANAGPMVINITVPGAKEFFEKETVRVVVENPRAVQSAVLSSSRANAGRRELTSLQLSPGTLTS